MSSQRPTVAMLIGSADRGGAEGQAVRLACELSAGGLDVRMLFLARGGPHTASLDACGVPWEIIGPNGNGRLGARKPAVAVRMIRAMRRIRPAVVMTWMPGAIATLPLFAPFTRAATVAAFRGVTAPAARPTIQNHLTRWGTRRADAVTINSPTLATEAAAWGADESMVRLLPNGVDLPPHIAGVDRQPPTGLVVANLRPVKNIPLLVQALGLVEPDVAIRVCGEGDPTPFIDQARRIGVADRITFVDSPANVPAEIAAAQFGIHPSLSEGLPNAVLELMAHGRPVVATAVGGIPTLIDHGRSGLLVDSDDAPALAEAIDSMASSPAERVAMGQAARERASDFDWESSTRGYLELIDELLDGDASRGVEE